MSLVSAKMAVTKAREVAAMVAQLQAVGVTVAEIEVAGVGIDVSAGIVMKTSEVTYALCIACRSLEMMPDILGVIAAQKTAKLSSIEWQYPDETALRAQWLDEAIEEANIKARRIAASLGVQLAGIRQFTDTFHDAERPDIFSDSLSIGRARRMSEPDYSQGPAPLNIGVNIIHSKSVALQIHVDYRISGYRSAE